MAACPEFRVGCRLVQELFTLPLYFHILLLLGRFYILLYLSNFADIPLSAVDKPDSLELTHQYFLPLCSSARPTPRAL